ncbi:acetylornithine deacetylase [Thalassovita mangrovi]|uniref:Acetylornithine deacetylase n=1 Tax=Thalassovita mangrovi TaxID=2692236 RepID=A0A6L8LGM1_9RHOB|nr:acetylornithine deacetylase [Thalassovita mangrovi]MYM55271.1 acetylornithine deacetylase [Thalassovita mangrovi]
MLETEILARLVGFETITDGPNLDLVDWVQDFLSDAGFDVTRIPSSCGTKAGLLARFGAGDGGVLFSAHSDVVPVAGQDWQTDPFTLTERDGRLIGRGSTDMKGFLACILAHAAEVKQAPPKRPMMIALSWDEEIGCRGIPEMIDMVIPTLGRPDLVIVGEPTEMRLCTGHKGKAAYRATCHGQPGHSAMAPLFTNALHLGADLISALRRVQARLAETGARKDGYQIPYSTLHAGRMSGGVALNMMPEEALIDFEIRHLAAEPAETLLAEVRQGLPEGIEIAEVASYPGLAADPKQPEIAALAQLLDNPEPVKVSYGTEAGFFAALGLPTVVCGPGSMADGHQPNESIAVGELERCSRLIAAFLN